MAAPGRQLGPCTHTSSGQSAGTSGTWPPSCRDPCQLQAAAWTRVDGQVETRAFVSAGVAREAATAVEKSTAAAAAAAAAAEQEPFADRFDPCTTLHARRAARCRTRANRPDMCTEPLPSRPDMAAAPWQQMASAGTYGGAAADASD